MALKGIFVICFCLIMTSIYGQSRNLILSKEQNNKWLDSLKTLSLDNQLLSIKERVLADTNIYLIQSQPDTKNNTVDSSLNKVLGEGKPLIIIGGIEIAIDNKTESNRILSFSKFLTSKYIQSIYIVYPNDPAANAFYGTDGKYGIFLMSVTKKKYEKLLKKLAFKHHY